MPVCQISAPVCRTELQLAPVQAQNVLLSACALCEQRIQGCNQQWKPWLFTSSIVCQQTDQSDELECAILAALLELKHHMHHLDHYVDAGSIAFVDIHAYWTEMQRCVAVLCSACDGVAFRGVGLSYDYLGHTQIPERLHRCHMQLALYQLGVGRQPDPGSG